MICLVLLIIKQKGRRCIYHFSRRYIREKTTAQHYHAYLFGWIKTYYTAITIYAIIAKESTTIVIESRIIFSFFI